MEITEIIERLKQHDLEMLFIRNTLIPYDHIKNREALQEGIELLKKHIPVKVSTNDLDSPLCPCCKKMFYTLYTHYCPNCSQALNWDEFFKVKKERLHD